MSRPSVGDRVVAVASADDAEVRVFGHGVYAGEEVPVDGEGFMAECLRKLELRNPRINLDSGETVWGCECWWGAESAYAVGFLKGRKEVPVSITAMRAEVAAANARARANAKGTEG